MDNRERIDSLLVAVQTATKEAQYSIWTALPGILESFDAAAGTCSVQPSIQAQVSDKAGAKSWVNLPLLVDVPVQFFGGNGFVLTMPCAKGDEGLIVFSSRCIDAWWQQGGVQKQAELRQHDLSDGFFLPGFRSQAHKITNANTSFPELRNSDASVKLTMAADGFDIAGNLRVTGSIIAGFGGADQIGVQTHRHQSGPTNPPTPGT